MREALGVVGAHPQCAVADARALRATCSDLMRSPGLCRRLCLAHPLWPVWQAVPAGVAPRALPAWPALLTELAALLPAFAALTPAHMVEVGTQLGAGPLGCVELARHTPSETWIALKSYAKAALVKHGRVAEAMAEKRALVRLRGHPHVVVLLGTAQHSALLFFALQLCPGGDLVDAVRAAGGRVAPEQRWQWLRQLAAALHYVHACRIIHRDV